MHLRHLIMLVCLVDFIQCTRVKARPYQMHVHSHQIHVPPTCERCQVEP